MPDTRYIAERARELAAPAAREIGVEIIDAEFVKDGADWHLRIYIDKRGGVRIDDCEKLSKELSASLDREDAIDAQYMLVVSSPGIDRPLSTEADFARYGGAAVDIKLLPGRLKEGLRPESPDGTGVNKENAGGKKKARAPGEPDVISGTLGKLENGRVYLTDKKGVAYSVAREDIKTVTRAISFK